MSIDHEIHEAEPVREQQRPLQQSQSGALELPSRGQATAVVASASRAWAETKAMMEYARQFPRNEPLARQRVLEACERPNFADAAAWEFERGKKKDANGRTVMGADGKPEPNMVNGPSVYLAREMKRLWGNIESGVLILEDDGESIHGQSFARDLETNTHEKLEWKVRKLIQRKVWRDGKPLRGPDGKDVTEWKVPDERDLLEMVNRTGQKAVRNCILYLMPDDLKEQALQRAEETTLRFATGEIDQDGKLTQKGAAKDGKCAPKAIDSLVGEFRRIGVALALLETKLGHSIDELKPDEYKNLARLGAAIKQGQMSVNDAFPPPEPEKGAEGASAAEPESEPSLEEAAELFDRKPGTMDEVVAQAQAKKAKDKPAAKPAAPAAAPAQSTLPEDPDPRKPEER